MRKHLKQWPQNGVKGCTVCHNNYILYLFLYEPHHEKTGFCQGENKGAGNREADQRLCFRYSDSTISLLLKSEISSF